MEPVVRAVDVGRANTKYVLGLEGDEIRCAHFPSEAYPAERIEDQDALGARRRTVGIPIDDLVYEVGPDVRFAADVFTAKVLQHDAYADAPEYMALMRGALHYMKVEHVDLLMLGLPVATSKVKGVAASIEKRMAGEHLIGKGRVVKVAKVKAIAQPAGALLYYGQVHNRVAELRNERSLVIDVGRSTFDWLITEGMQQVNKRSHSVSRGMFDVLQAIAHGVSTSLGIQFRDFELIDEALRTGKNPVIFQEAYDIARHLPLARKVADQAVGEMLHYVGNAADIRNIILVGGAAFFFKKAIKKAFPKHRLHEIKDPIYANVKGFQLAGMQYARSLLQTRPTAISEASAVQPES